MSWSFEIPARGKFVALYDDGDGAAFFRWDDDGTLFDGQGDVLGVFDEAALLAYLAEAGFYCWQALPEGFVMFWEAVTIWHDEASIVAELIGARNILDFLVLDEVRV